VGKYWHKPKAEAQKCYNTELLTFAQMLAALTIEYSESAFFATVIFIEGKHSSSFFW